MALGISPHAVEWRLDSNSFPDYKRFPVKRPAAWAHLVGRALIEPERWPFAGDLTRREPVLDPNVDPPRVVRRVGYVRCMSCGRPHFSEDVASVRICFECGGSGSVPVGRMSSLESESP